jgi:predicted AlkP superfamily pyrophosphatase or phosphodiesterase
MKKIKPILLIAIFIIPLFTSAQINRFPSKKPKLIVQIAIDYFRLDMLYKYRAKLGEKGFMRLMEEGTFCKNASLEYGITQPAPGYATIATGAQPAVHGIISNNWFNPIKKTIIDACYDKSVKVTGASNSTELQVSPKHLFSSTFTDELKLALGSKSKIISVALDPCAAVLLAGHNADGAYYYDNSTGNFVTNSFYSDSLPGWVRKFNK